MEWKDKILKEAVRKGLCEEFQQILPQQSSVLDYIKLYKVDTSWCMGHRFPNIDTIREHLGGFEEEGIYIDHTFNGEILAKHQVYILHNCKGIVKVGFNSNDKISPIIYTANGCELYIEGEALNMPSPTKYYIYTYDDSIIRGIQVKNVEYKIVSK